MQTQTIQYTKLYRNWCDILELDKTEPIQYLKIGSLHGGIVCAFHTHFGPRVQSKIIDPTRITTNLNKMKIIKSHHTNFYQHSKTIITLLFMLLEIIIQVIY